MSVVLQELVPAGGVRSVAACAGAAARSAAVATATLELAVDVGPGAVSPGLLRQSRSKQVVPSAKHFDSIPPYVSEAN